jgi:hypothetical protein
VSARSGQPPHQDHGVEREDDDDGVPIGVITDDRGQLQTPKIGSADDAGVGVLLDAAGDVLRVVVVLLRVPRRRVEHQRLGSVLLVSVLLVAAVFLVPVLLLRPGADRGYLCGRGLAQLGHDVDGVDQADHRHRAVFHVHGERVDA